MTLSDKSVRRVSFLRPNGRIFSCLDKWSIVPGLVAVILLILGCSEKPTRPGGNYVPRYSFESEPTLSPDRQWVYFIATDTVTPANSGIYRAPISRPASETVLLGESLHSPTIAPDNRTLAYLDAGEIEYYDLLSQTGSSANIRRAFESIQYINDSLLVAQADSSVWLINDRRSMVSHIGRGRDPSALVGDTFIYLAPVDGTAGGIVKCDASFAVRDTIFCIAPHDQPGSARWPAWDPAGSTMVWVYHTSSDTAVYVGQGQPSNNRRLAATTQRKALIVRPGTVIFTGNDGRFYQTDYTGSDPFLWWPREPNE